MTMFQEPRRMKDGIKLKEIIQIISKLLLKVNVTVMMKNYYLDQSELTFLFKHKENSAKSCLPFVECLGTILFEHHKSTMDGSPVGTWSRVHESGFYHVNWRRHHSGTEACAESRHKMTWHIVSHQLHTQDSHLDQVI